MSVACGNLAAYMGEAVGSELGKDKWGVAVMHHCVL